MTHNCDTHRSDRRVIAAELLLIPEVCKSVKMAIAPASNCTSHLKPGPIELVTDSLAFGVFFAITFTVVQRGVGFVRSVLFCRIMTDQELGQWSMVYSFLMLLVPFAVLGLPGSFGRFAEHYLQRGQLGTFVRRIATISSIPTLGLAASMYLAPEYYSELIFRSASQTGVVNAMAFALVFCAANSFLSTLMESLRQIRLVTLMRLATAVIFAILGTAMIATSPDGASSAATLAFGVACLAGMAPAVVFLWTHRTRFAFADSHLDYVSMWKRIAPFAIWLWATNLVTNLLEVSDRYMLIHWSTVSADEAQAFVGQYHSGRMLPLLLIGVGVVMEGILLPYMTALWEQNRKSQAVDQFSLVIKSMAIGFTVAGIASLLFAPLLFDGILAGRYNGGLFVLPMTLVYCIWFAMSSAGQSWMWVAEKGKYVFVVTGTALLANLVLNALLIPPYGLSGAVIATSAAALLCLLMTMIANAMNGLRMNSGWLITSLFPLSILLPVTSAIIVAMAILLIAVSTNWVFNSQEKTLAYEEVGKLKNRLSNWGR